jgi:hypothetical protein
MSNLRPSLLPEPNPVTQARHRHEVLWQITVPVAVAAIVILALAILAGVLGTANDHSRWADVSLIWLVMPVVVFTLIFLILLLAVVYGLVKLIEVLPPYARQLQEFFVLITFQVGKVGDKIVEPILRTRTFTASVRAFGRSLSAGRGVRRR